jgi:hypothetical protein
MSDSNNWSLIKIDLNTYPEWMIISIIKNNLKDFCIKTEYGGYKIKKEFIDMLLRLRYWDAIELVMFSYPFLYLLFGCGSLACECNGGYICCQIYYFINYICEKYEDYSYLIERLVQRCPEVLCKTPSHCTNMIHYVGYNANYVNTKKIMECTLKYITKNECCKIISSRIALSIADKKMIAYYVVFREKAFHPYVQLTNVHYILNNDLMWYCYFGIQISWKTKDNYLEKLLKEIKWQARKPILVAHCKEIKSPFYNMPIDLIRHVVEFV